MELALRKTIRQIFEPFFSTGKKGTGLGLWVTQDIVDNTAGELKLAGELDAELFLASFFRLIRRHLRDQDRKEPWWR